MVRDVTRELGYLPLGSRLKRVGERLQAETARFLLNEGVDMPQGVWPLLVTLGLLFFVLASYAPNAASKGPSPPRAGAAVAIRGPPSAAA